MTTFTKTLHYIFSQNPYYKLFALSSTDLISSNSFKEFVEDLSALQLTNGAFPAGWNKLYSESPLASAKALLVMKSLKKISNKIIEYLKRSISSYGFWKEDPIQLSAVEDFIDPRDYTTSSLYSSLLVAYALKAYRRRTYKTFIDALKAAQATNGLWYSQGRPSILITSLAIILFKDSLDKSALFAAKNLKTLLSKLQPSPLTALAYLGLGLYNPDYAQKGLEILNATQLPTGGWSIKQRKPSPALTSLIFFILTKYRRLNIYRNFLNDINSYYSNLLKLRKILLNNYPFIENKLKNMLIYNYILFPDNKKETLLRIFVFSILSNFRSEIDVFTTFSNIIKSLNFKPLLNYSESTLSDVFFNILSKYNIYKSLIFKTIKSTILFRNFIKKIENPSNLSLEDFTFRLSEYILFESSSAIQEKISHLGELLYMYNRKVFDKNTLILCLETMPGLSRYSADLFLFLSCNIAKIIESKYSFLPIDWSIVKPLIMCNIFSSKLISAYRVKGKIYDYVVNLLSTILYNNIHVAYYLSYISEQWCFKRTCINIKGPCPLISLCVQKYQNYKP